MKKRIVIGLTVFTSIFFLGGIYLVTTIEKATFTMGNLIKLHQVEIMREQLLIGARRVQSDLAFQRTRYARELDTVVANVIRMDNDADKCRGCHHAKEIKEKITALKKQIQVYKDTLSRVLTIRGKTARLETEEDMAFLEGHKLIYQLNAMTSMTQARLAERTQSTLKEIDRTKMLLFFSIAIGPFLAVGLAIIFIKGFTKPFNALLQATRNIKSGDLSFRIQGLRDEFGELATSFNEMAASLNEQMHKMQRAEQMTMVGEMAAGLVHEIRNPLAGIKGSMQFLREEVFAEEDRTILSKVIDEVQRVELLMNGLLNFAKPPQPLFIPVHMNDLLGTALDFLQSYPSMAPNAPNPINIIKNFAPHLPMTMADPAEMQQVFLNLFMNAVEAMPAGGTLTVRTSGSESAKEIRIEIADTGAGIDEEIRGKIFQPFFTAKHKGTGLGLAISKQFVEINGGTISAENNPEGGAIFRIVLPFAQTEELAGHPS